MSTDTSILGERIARAKKHGGGEVAYGYNDKDCEIFHDYIRKFWPGERVYVYTDHDPRREYLRCIVVVEDYKSGSQPKL